MSPTTQFPINSEKMLLTLIDMQPDFDLILLILMGNSVTAITSAFRHLISLMRFEIYFRKFRLSFQYLPSQVRKTLYFRSNYYANFGNSKIRGRFLD